MRARDVLELHVLMRLHWSCRGVRTAKGFDLASSGCIPSRIPSTRLAIGSAQAGEAESGAQRPGGLSPEEVKGGRTANEEHDAGFDDTEEKI